MRRRLLNQAQLTLLITLLITLPLIACGGGDTEIPESPLDDLTVQFTDEIPTEPPPPSTPAPDPTMDPAMDPTTDPTMEPAPAPSPTPEPTRPPDLGEPPDPNELQGLALMSYERARRLAGQGEHQQAISAYREAFRKHTGESLQLEAGIARAYHATGAYLEAIRHFKLGLKIQQDPMVHAHLAQTYLDLDDCTRAINHSDLALSVYSVLEENLNSHTEANYIMAACYQQQEQGTLAVRHITRALIDAEESSYPRARLLEIRELAGKLNVTLTAITAEPTPTPGPTPGPTPTPMPPPPEFTGRAAELVTDIRTEILAGEFEHALHLMAELQDLHPDPSAIIMGLRGDAYQGMADTGEAMRHYELALEIQKALGTQQDPEYLVKLAQISVELDQYESALDYATRAIRTKQFSWETHGGRTRYNSNAEAGRILTQLHLQKQRYETAHKYSNTAYKAAFEANYPPEMVQELLEIREDLQNILDALRAHREKKAGRRESGS